jgi:hypothetical protein
VLIAHRPPQCHKSSFSFDNILSPSSHRSLCAAQLAEIMYGASFMPADSRMCTCLPRYARPIASSPPIMQTLVVSSLARSAVTLARTTQHNRPEGTKDVLRRSIQNPSQ